MELKVDQDLGEPLGINPIEDENILKIKVNNLVNDIINITSDSQITGKLKIEIYDMNGENKYTNEFKSNNESLEKQILVSEYQHGLYILKISKNDKEIYSNKIVIQN